jgi:hypothetical protein
MMFKLTSFSAVGAKSLATQYERFGFKLVSQKFDKKKEVYISEFNDSIKGYVSDRVFDGTRPVTGKRLERLKAKRAKELKKRK